VSKTTSSASDTIQAFGLPASSDGS